MWETILKKPITIGTTRIGLKPLPEDEDCCENAKNKWRVYIVRNIWLGILQPKSLYYDFKKKYNHDFNMDNDEDCIKIYNMADDTYSANNDCEIFRAFIERNTNNSDMKTKILDEWDKCEGR